eukprot:607829-Prorocentrum_minimum.AAC.2
MKSRQDAIHKAEPDWLISCSLQTLREDRARKSRQDAIHKRRVDAADERARELEESGRKAMGDHARVQEELRSAVFQKVPQGGPKRGSKRGLNGV